MKMNHDEEEVENDKTIKMENENFFPKIALLYISISIVITILLGDTGFYLSGIVFILIWVYAFFSTIFKKEKGKLAWIIALILLPITCYFYLDARAREKYE